MFEVGTATDFADLAIKLDAFLATNGSAFGLTYAGTGNGTLTAYRGGASSVAETFTITATSATNFTVVGSLAGSIGPATVGTPFSHAKIAFTLTAGGTAFVSGDVFTLSTSPKWIQKRKALGGVVTATQGNTGLQGAQNLLDGKNQVEEQRNWKAPAPLTLPQDVQIQLREAQTINRYQVAGFAAAVAGLYVYEPKAWTFDYWNGSAWVTLDTQSGILSWGQSEVKEFLIASPVSASLYRLHITEVQFPSEYTRLGAIRLLRSSDGVDAALGQYIWQAPGNDGDSEIFCGLHMYQRADADYFNWEMASFDGYNANARFHQQPGFHGNTHLPLWDDPIPYWFVADGRRCVVVAKVNAQYEMAVIGFCEPYFSPDQWPYPAIVGGSMAFSVEEKIPTWDSPRLRHSNATHEHRIPSHSDGFTADFLHTPSYQLRVRNVDGSWSGYEASDGDSAATVPTSGINIIWPFRCGMTLADPNIDGSYAIIPIMLCSSAPNIVGQLPGIAAVSGQGLSAETLIRKGAVDWLVVPNIFRVDRDDFVAVALD